MWEQSRLLNTWVWQSFFPPHVFWHPWPRPNEHSLCLSLSLPHSLHFAHCSGEFFKWLWAFLFKVTNSLPLRHLAQSWVSKGVWKQYSYSRPIKRCSKLNSCCLWPWGHSLSFVLCHLSVVLVGLLFPRTDFSGLVRAQPSPILIYLGCVGWKTKKLTCGWRSMVDLFCFPQQQRH